ncbi:MAG: addiction module protein [Methylacidiphilales bacterium]|nr:addiction module protein [Candidatus Methylacidiphilales bacterium]
MTLASVKKLAVQLPPAQRMKLADVLLGTLPPMRKPVTLAELERRIDEVESGKVKAVPGDVFDADLEEMEKSIRQRRLAHRG